MRSNAARNRYNNLGMFKTQLHANEMARARMSNPRTHAKITINGRSTRAVSAAASASDFHII